MNSIGSLLCFSALYFLLDGQPVHADANHEWETGYHPFPEMSRFLNSHSRIHRPSEKKASDASYSFLENLCSIADDDDKLADLLETFDGKHRSLMTAIIEQDCSHYHQQLKRMMREPRRRHYSSGEDKDQTSMM